MPNYDAAITPFCCRIFFRDYVARSHTKRITTRSAVTKTTVSQNFCSMLSFTILEEKCHAGQVSKNPRGWQY
jgi:hypothetical protein